jgi:hypothetical protein
VARSVLVSAVSGSESTAMSRPVCKIAARAARSWSDCRRPRSPRCGGPRRPECVPARGRRGRSPERRSERTISTSSTFVRPGRRASISSLACPDSGLLVTAPVSVSADPRSPPAATRPNRASSAQTQNARRGRAVARSASRRGPKCSARPPPSLLAGASTRPPSPARQRAPDQQPRDFAL